MVIVTIMKRKKRRKREDEKNGDDKSDQNEDGYEGVTKTTRLGFTKTFSAAESKNGTF